MLCENHTHRLPDRQHATANVTIDALLRLMATAFLESSEELGNPISTPDSYISKCHRFEIRRQKNDEDNTPLFVQQQTDYFQRLELFIDNQLIAAYQEPVWPHLQDQQSLGVSQLNLPVACMEFLEHRASSTSGSHSSLESANQAFHQDDDQAASA